MTWLLKAYPSILVLWSCALQGAALLMHDAEGKATVRFCAITAMLLAIYVKRAD